MFVMLVRTRRALSLANILPRFLKIRLINVVLLKGIFEYLDEVPEVGGHHEQMRSAGQLRMRGPQHRVQRERSAPQRVVRLLRRHVSSKARQAVTTHTSAPNQTISHQTYCPPAIVSKFTTSSSVIVNLISFVHTTLASTVNR